MRRVKVDETGAVAVMVAMMLVAILGAAALAVDMGAMYVERRELQNGADAAVLAIAEDCANGVCDTLLNEATAKIYVDANARDSVSYPESVTLLSAEQRVTVVNRTLRQDGADGLHALFARAFGWETLPAERAQATAGWWAAGLPGDIGAAPIAASMCEFLGLTDGDTFTLADIDAKVATLPSVDGLPTENGFVTAGMEIALHDPQSDTGDTCAAEPGFSSTSDGDIMPAGFGWLQLDNEDACSLDVTSEVQDAEGNETGEFWVPAVSGNYPGGLDCLVQQYLKAPTIPIFTGFENNKTDPQESAYTANNGDEYRLYGPAAFYITGIDIPGAKFGHKCTTAKEWCIRGHFVKKNDATGTETTGSTSLGVTSVGLVN